MYDLGSVQRMVVGEASCAFRRLITRPMMSDRRCSSCQEPSAVSIQAIFIERRSSGNSFRRLRALETTAVAASVARYLFGPSVMQATPPCRKSSSPGLRVRASTATSLAGCCVELAAKTAGVACAGPCPRAKKGTVGGGGRPTAGADGARGRPAAGAPASVSRWLRLVVAARAAYRVSLAREVESVASWEAPTAADASSFASVSAIARLRIVFAEAAGLGNRAIHLWHRARFRIFGLGLGGSWRIPCCCPSSSCQSHPRSGTGADLDKLRVLRHRTASLFVTLSLFHRQFLA